MRFEGGRSNSDKEEMYGEGRKGRRCERCVLYIRKRAISRDSFSRSIIPVRGHQNSAGQLGGSKFKP